MILLYKKQTKQLNLTRNLNLTIHSVMKFFKCSKKKKLKVIMKEKARLIPRNQKNLIHKKKIH